MSKTIEKINQKLILALEKELDDVEKDIGFFSDKIVGLEARRVALLKEYELQTEDLTKDQKEDLI